MVNVQVTCRDEETSRRTRRLVSAHAPALQEYGDLVELCHVIIHHRAAPAHADRGYAVAIDLILHDGRAVEACLRDRHIYFEYLESAVDEAFHELRCWLREMAPHWRQTPPDYVPCGCILCTCPIDRPEDVTELCIVDAAECGAHHFVG